MQTFSLAPPLLFQHHLEAQIPPCACTVLEKTHYCKLSTKLDGLVDVWHQDSIGNEARPIFAGGMLLIDFRTEDANENHVEAAEQMGTHFGKLLGKNAEELVVPVPVKFLVQTQTTKTRHEKHLITVLLLHCRTKLQRELQSGIIGSQTSDDFHQGHDGDWIPQVEYTTPG